MKNILIISFFLSLVSIVNADFLPYGITDQTKDQSAYALGSLTLNVIFPESNGAIDVNQENWTSSQLQTMRNELTEMANWWENTTSSFHPNAQLSINLNYVNSGVPIQTSYEPIIRNGVGTEFNVWANQVMSGLGYTNSNIFTNVANFNKDQRVINETNWSATMFVVNDLVDSDNRFKDNYFAYAWLGGPFMTLTYSNNGWGSSRFGQVSAHELGHIFYALDEYPDSGGVYTDFGGYLNTQNLNAYDGHPDPSSRYDSLMAEANKQTNAYNWGIIGASGSDMVGHKDINGNGTPDILDTSPTLTSISVTPNIKNGTINIDLFGEVTTLLNQNNRSNSIADSTIVKLSRGEYKYNSSDWITFDTFGNYSENIELDLVFSSGLNNIFIRIMNEVDNYSDVLNYQFTSNNDIMGDINRDSLVNLYDLEILADNFEFIGTWETGDLNGDGVVDWNDIDLMEFWWGIMPHGYNSDIMLFSDALNIVNIPEPGSLILIACGFGFIFFHRTKKV